MLLALDRARVLVGQVDLNDAGGGGPIDLGRGGRGAEADLEAAVGLGRQRERRVAARLGRGDRDVVLGREEVVLAGIGVVRERRPRDEGARRVALALGP